MVKVFFLKRTINYWLGFMSDISEKIEFMSGRRIELKEG